MKSVKKILLITVSIPLLGILLFILFLVIGQLTKYRPQALIPLVNTGNKNFRPEAAPPAVLSFLSWNTGYCGLDEATDFVMEGGKQGIARNKSVVEENLQSLIAVCREIAPDILFLQEVDKQSARSYNVNQLTGWERAFPDYAAWFGINFLAFFVPYPLSSPIGKVQSGILSLSRFQAKTATRYQLPGLYNWPVGLFNLKRCMVVNTLDSPVPGKDWYLINIHQMPMMLPVCCAGNNSVLLKTLSPHSISRSITSL